jgi:hypothetical protein
MLEERAVAEAIAIHERCYTTTTMGMTTRQTGVRTETAIEQRASSMLEA